VNGFGGSSLQPIFGAKPALQKFAQNNPEGLQINTAQFVGDASYEAYRCNRK